jgi:hypothetical protein
MSAQATAIAVEPYELEMIRGRALAAQRRWADAYRHFVSAHDVGHSSRTRHLAAHRAALDVALRSRRPDRTLYQVVFLGFAWLTAPRDEGGTSDRRATDTRPSHS